MSDRSRSTINGIALRLSIPSGFPTYPYHDGPPKYTEISDFFQAVTYMCGTAVSAIENSVRTRVLAFVSVPNGRARFYCRQISIISRSVWLCIVYLRRITFVAVCTTAVFILFLYGQNGAPLNLYYYLFINRTRPPGKCSGVDTYFRIYRRVRFYPSATRVAKSTHRDSTSFIHYNAYTYIRCLRLYLYIRRQKKTY